MINNHKPHHIYLHKRIPDIIIEPKNNKQTQNPKDNDVNDNIIPISNIITKNKHKIKIT